jgi:Mor family transcriptional regulator
MTEAEKEKRDKALYKDHESGMPITEIVGKYGISHTQIYNIIHEVDAKSTV